MTELFVTVYGTPAPQGSKSLMRGRLVESSKRVKPWRAAVVQAVRDNPRILRFTGRVPVEADITFLLERPAAHYGTGRNAARLRGDAPAYPVARQRDDIDKLCRSTLDALTESGVLADDSQVTQLVARKRYAEAGTIPGALIRVSTMEALR